jgi:mannose-6-phosphate isomerase-like protein (cupin superfamily)
MKVIDRKSAEHYIWGTICDGWHLVKNQNLSVITEKVPPGAKEIRHYHKKAHQFFYILSGEAIIEVEGKHIKLNEGQGIEIPPEIPHQFMNESNSDVNFLVISQPPSKADRIEV